MFKHYLQTAFRHFRKHKLSAAINVLGLSIGISAALVIFIIVKYDYSFDKFQPDNDRIFRVVSDGDGWKNSGVPTPFPLALQQNAGGLATVAPVFTYGWNTPVTIPTNSKQPDKLFKKQEGIVFTDAGYFDIFPHKWLAGSAATAFKQPYGLVLSAERAKLYFPNVQSDHLIGHTVIFNDTVKTTITGIVADIKENSDFKYGAFISLTTVYNTGLKTSFNTDHWDNTNSSNQVFVKLSPKVTEAGVNKQITDVFDQHKPKDDDAKTVHRLQALSDIHTNIDYDGQVNTETLRNLAILAIFLLALGAINFVNLSTAQASERAKDIGIRKTLGGLKSQLITQFLTETLLLTTFTAVVSLALLPLLLMVFSGFIPEGLSASYILQEPMVWGFLLLLVIVVSLVAGLYPALVLTRFQPASVLKNTVINSTGGTRGSWLRSSLIVSQFVIAQVFVIAVLVVNKQVQFAVQKDMGFRKNAIINIRIPFNFFKPDGKGFILKNELNAMSGVQAVSLGSQSPAFGGSSSTRVSYKEKDKDIELSVAQRSGDTSFLKVYQIPLIAGRNIVASDTANELLINETLAKQAGFQHPAQAVGHTLNYGGGPKPIVGVMRDFNQASVRRNIEPLIYFSAPKFGYMMHVALTPDPATWKMTIDQTQRAWKSIYPDVDFEYNFLDQQVEKFYKTEQQLSMLLAWSAGVAILISCLGMLGLVIFMTNKRVKEIGIRKVLGATVTEIVALLSIDFAKLLVLAFAIAVPIAWWQMNKWLQTFAFHTPLSWWLFAISGVFMIVIALFIVSIRAGKAALVNPANSLRAD